MLLVSRFLLWLYAVLELHADVLAVTPLRQNRRVILNLLPVRESVEGFGVGVELGG